MLVDSRPRIGSRGGPGTGVAPEAPVPDRGRSRLGRVRRAAPRVPHSAAPSRRRSPLRSPHPHGRRAPPRALASRSCSRPPWIPPRTGPRRLLKSAAGAVALEASAPRSHSGVAALAPCEPVECSRHADPDQLRGVKPARSTPRVVPPRPARTKKPAAQASRRAICTVRMESRRAVTMASMADELLWTQPRSGPRRASTGNRRWVGKMRVVRRIFQKSDSCT